MESTSSSTCVEVRYLWGRCVCTFCSLHVMGGRVLPEVGWGLAGALAGALAGCLASGFLGPLATGVCGRAGFFPVWGRLGGVKGVHETHLFCPYCVCAMQSGDW